MPTPTITLTFEEGTSGSSLTATGSYAAVTSPAPIYSSTAALHGSLGCTTPSGGGSTSGPNFTITRSASFTNANKDCTVSLYVQPVSIPGGALRLLNFQNSTNNNIGYVRAHSSGHFDIANSAGTQQAATTLSWATGTWYRLDVTYTGSTNSVTVNVFAGTNVEGSTADATITATVTSQTGGLDHWVVSAGSSSTAACQAYLDTVRFYDGVVTPTAYLVDYSGTGTLSGSGSLSSSGTPGPVAAVPLGGSGSLSGSGIASAASMSGSGSLSPSSASVTAQGTGALSGSGSLDSSALVAVAPPAALTGSGALVATPGQSPVVALTFDGGTDGTALAAGGAISSVTGTMTYAAAAAKHGAEGLSGTAVTASNPAFIVPRSASFTDANKSCTVSMYVQPVALSSGSITWVALQTASNTNLVTVRCNANTGVFDLYAGGILAASSLTYTLGTWYRLDLVYNGATSAVTLTIFAGANVEGTTPDSTTTATAVAGALDHWNFSPARGPSTTTSGYLDTVRIYDGTLTPAPYGALAFAGSPALSGAGTLSSPTGTQALSKTVATSGVGVLNNGALAFTGSAALAGSGALTATGNDMVILTFEEGADGAALPAGGAISAVTTPAPTYSAAAARHGGLGVTGVGTTGGPSFTVPRPAGFSNANASVTYSIYAQPLTVPGGALRLLALKNAAGTTLAIVRFNTSGKIDIANSAGNQVTATTLSWIANTWYRLDTSVDCAGNVVTVNVFAGANSEGVTPDATIAWTSATITGLSSAIISTGSASTVGAQAYVDTVRIYDGVVTPAPYNPGNTAGLTGTGSLAAAGSTGNAPGLLTGAGTLTVTGAEQVVHTWVGAPSTTGFTIKARTTGFAAPGLLVSVNSNMSAAVSFGATAPDAAGYVTAVASGLSPGVRYYYQLTDTVAGVTTAYGPIARARTLPTVSGGQSFRVAFGSCVTTNATDPSALNDVVGWDPDLFIHLGDFDYSGDTSIDPVHQRSTYENQILGTSGLSNLMANVPWAYCTSDHEAGPDNGDSNNDYTAANISAYSQIVPTYPLADTRTPVAGRYQTWVIGRVRFILLDIRNTDRSPGANVDDATKTMLGATQKAWLKSQLVAAEPVKVILSDVAWMGAASTTNGPDKWWSYSTERQELSDYIAANSVKVLFWHGDSHALAVATPAQNTWGGFPVYCSSPLRNTGGGRNLTTFSSYYTNGGAACAQYARVTITDNGSNITFAYSGWDALSQVVRVSQTDVIATPTTPALSGSGGLGGTGRPGFPSGVSLSGSGGLGASIAAAPKGSATLAGSGALSAASTAMTAAGAGALSGSGALAVAPQLAVARTAAVSGSGALTAAATPRVPGTAALTGIGALTGALMAVGFTSGLGFGNNAFGSGSFGGVDQASPLSATGTLGSPGGTPTPAVIAALSGSGGLTTTAALGRSGTAALSGSGALGTGAVVTLSGAAALAGSGALTGAGVTNRTGTATLAGSGALVGNGGAQIVAIGAGFAVQLSGAGLLAVGSAIAGTPAAVTILGSGALTAGGSGTARGAGALTGSGALSNAATVVAAGVGTLSGLGVLGAVGVSVFAAGIGFAGSGSLLAGPTPRLSAAVAFTGSGLLIAAGGMQDTGNVVALAGSGALAVVGSLGVGASREGVTDPGFERSPSPWVTTGVLWSLDNTFARTGTTSIKGAATAVAQSVNVPLDYPGGKAPVLPGQVWVASAWVYTSLDYAGSGANSKLRLGDQSGGGLATVTWVGNPGTWSLRTITYTVPATTPPTALSLSLVNDATAGSVWVDDVSLHMLSDVGGVAPPTPTLAGSGALSPALVAVARSVAPGLTGAGTLAVAVTPRPSVGLYSSFAGAGTLTSVGGVYGFTPTPNLTGSGALVAGGSPAAQVNQVVNLVPNPTAAVNLGGFSGTWQNTPGTITRLTGLTGLPVTTGVDYSQAAATRAWSVFMDAVGPAGTLRAGQVYTLSYWAQAVSGPLTGVQVSIRDSNGANVVSNPPAITLSNGWQRFTATFTALIDSLATSTIYVSVNTNAALDYQFAGFQLQAGSYATAFTDNSTGTFTGVGTLASLAAPGPVRTAALTGTGLLSGTGTPNALPLTPLTGVGTLAGTQSGMTATGAGVGLGGIPLGSGPLGGAGSTALTGLGTLAPIDAVALSGRANLAATGQLLSAAGVTASGVAAAFMVGTLSIPHQHGELIGADHPLWADPADSRPVPWVRPASPDLIAALVHDSLRVRRTRAY